VVATRTEQVAAADGGRFAAHVAVPHGGSGPGVLVFQEIFGVNAYVRDVCARLAEMGMVAMAPDVFWRTEPEVELEGHDDETLKHAMRLGKALDIDVAVQDMIAALTHLRSLPETTGRTGVLGFCMGGTLAFLVATRGDPDVCVSYYGSGVPGLISELPAAHCPIVFHFGGQDPVIPQERVAAVADAVRERSDVVVRVAPGGGHAFDNPASGPSYDADEAASAWAVTVMALEDALRS
jgi:carboxymethylenebutenolidase